MLNSRTLVLWWSIGYVQNNYLKVKKGEGFFKEPLEVPSLMYLRGNLSLMFHLTDADGVATLSDTPTSVSFYHTFQQVKKKNSK